MVKCLVVTEAGGSVEFQDAVPKGTTEVSMGTCADELATTGTTTADLSMVGYLVLSSTYTWTCFLVTKDPHTFQKLNAHTACIIHTRQAA